MASKIGRVGSLTRHLSEQERFWLKVEKRGEDECWPWLGCHHGDGYGFFISGGRQVRAHRYAYELEHGPISAGQVLHHRCHNPACVNPAHLEPLSRRENQARMKLRVPMEEFIGRLNAAADEADPPEVVLTIRHGWWIAREAHRRGTDPSEVLKHVLDTYLYTRAQRGERILE